MQCFSRFSPSSFAGRVKRRKRGDNRQGNIGPALTTTALAGDPAAEIQDVITDGTGEMPGFSSQMSSAQISALAEFLKNTPP